MHVTCNVVKFNKKSPFLIPLNLFYGIIDMLQDSQWECVSHWIYFYTITDEDKLLQSTNTAAMKDLGKILAKAVQGENEMHIVFVIARLLISTTQYSQAYSYPHIKNKQSVFHDRDLLQCYI